MMKLRKIFAGAAALAACAAMTVTSGAELVEVENIKGANGLDIFISNATMWMPIGYSNGERDASTKDVIDYGVDWSKAADIDVVFKVAEESYGDWEGAFGGAIVLSSQADGNTTHNWNAKDFWGVVDEDLEIDTVDPNKAFQLVKIGDHTYEGIAPIDDNNNVVDNAQLVQIAIQDYSNDPFYYMSVESMKIRDASGNTIIEWDKNGNVVGATAVTAAPVAAEEPAPEVTAEPAPATGDVAAATDSSKGSPDTGVADVAAVAGLAIVAAGAFIVAKKRK